MRCADRVHLHLEHHLVQRPLNRFLVRGFQGEALSRAAVIATHDNTAKLILLARLSLYGHGAARLHDEVLELVAFVFADHELRQPRDNRSCWDRRLPSAVRLRWPPHPASSPPGRSCFGRCRWCHDEPHLQPRPPRDP